MKNRRKAVQPFEIKKRKIDIFRNYEANGFEKNQRKFENFSTLISKKSILSYIDLSLKRNCRPEEKYLERMQRVFPYKDGKCCERIYNIVKKL